MTVTEIRSSNSIEFPVEDLPVTASGLRLGEIGAGEPVFYVPDGNPWLPWLNRAGGVALGACAGTIVTIVLHPALMWWAVATLISTALLFAWVAAGHELHGRRPRIFKRAP